MTVDNVAEEYSFDTYPTAYELFKALESNSDLEVSVKETVNRNSDELIIFSAIRLKGVYYLDTSGNNTSNTQQFTDNPPLFVHYAVDPRWHTAEIFKMNGTVYCTVDGVAMTYSDTAVDREFSIVSFGGNCDVLFKMLEIHPDSIHDAEVVEGIVISSMHPYIAIMEGHGLDKVAHGDGYATDDMATSIDRIQSLNEYALSKGYVPVGMHDIADYYDGKKMLPKRLVLLKRPMEYSTVC